MTDFAKFVCIVNRWPARVVSALYSRNPPYCGPRCLEDLNYCNV